MLGAILLGLPLAVAQEGGLAWMPERVVRLELPDSSRSSAMDENIPVHGPWTLVASAAGVRTWQAPLPVRPRTLTYTSTPEGMELRRRALPGEEDGGTELQRFAPGILEELREGSWEFSSRSVRVRRRAEEGPPRPDEYHLRYEASARRERSLQRAQAELDDLSFAFRSLQVGDTTRHGVFLPAPARITWRVEVPEEAVLELWPGLMPPEVQDDRASDGALLRVLVDDQPIGARALHGPPGEPWRLSMRDWAGKTAELSFVSEPGGDAHLDYVFLGSPTLRRPRQDPPRVVLLFVDTLRRDALSLYGQPRPTSPNIDAWARDGAVFEQARSVAPWTLPTARSLFTGAQPEDWTEARTLQARAGRAGWATAFFAGNVYLSSNFEMSRDFGVHRFAHLPRVDTQLRRARRWLREVGDQPAFLVLHLMDAHLPYREPWTWQRRFAGPHPKVLGPRTFIRRNVLNAEDRLGEEGRQYVRDRYHGVVSWLDARLGPFLASLGPQDTVLLLSDHGEEFWEHDGFEHGHALYDELLAVPLVLRAPGIPAGRSSAPVSLLDVAPTLAEIMGLDREGMVGRPLQQTLAAPEPARPIGFGRLLYGERLWGVVQADHKLITGRGEEWLFTLDDDPGERNNRIRALERERDGLAEAMGAALGMEVAVALRLVPSRSTSGKAFTLRLRVPGGFAEAWPAEDPLKLASVEIHPLGEDGLSITWAADARGEREVYVLPRAPLPEVLGQLEGEAEHRGARAELASSLDLPGAEAAGGPLYRARAGGRTVTIDPVRVPVPSRDRAPLSGLDGEMAEELKALGYLEH